MRNILLVDDNKYVLEALELTLNASMRGYDILQAGNGLEALHLLIQRPVALVLTDLEMPVMNGYQLIEHKNRLHPSIPLLAMTNNLSPIVTDGLRALGVRHCFEKPFNFEEVIRLIKESLSAAPFLMPERGIHAVQASASI